MTRNRLQESENHADLIEFESWTRVADVRNPHHPLGATVVQLDTSIRGRDGYGLVVIYDDEPGVPVSTGTDHFIGLHA